MGSSRRQLLLACPACARARYCIPTESTSYGSPTRSRAGRRSHDPEDAELSASCDAMHGVRGIAAARSERAGEPKQHCRAQAAPAWMRVSSGSTAPAGVAAAWMTRRRGWPLAQGPAAGSELTLRSFQGPLLRFSSRSGSAWLTRRRRRDASTRGPPGRCSSRPRPARSLHRPERKRFLKRSAWLLCLRMRQRPGRRAG